MVQKVQKSIIKYDRFSRTFFTAQSVLWHSLDQYKVIMSYAWCSDRKAHLGGIFSQNRGAASTLRGERRRRENRGNKGAERGRYGKGVSPPLPSWLDGLGELSYYKVITMSTPAENAFWRILNATECSFLHLYADALSSQTSCHIWGGKAEVWGST